VQKSIKICPVSGPGLLTKSERERRKVEIVNSFGANSAERFRSVVEGESGVTFREQSKVWLEQMKTRKRKPVKPATIVNWEMALNKWLLPLIGDFPLASVKNGTLKMLVSKFDEAGLSPSSIRTYCRVMTMVVGSLKDDDANPIYPRRWNYEFADAPEIGEQRRPSFTGEELTKLIAEVEGPVRMCLILFAASGLRAGELFGLEVKHFREIRKGSAVGLERGHSEAKDEVSISIRRTAFLRCSHAAKLHRRPQRRIHLCGSQWLIAASEQLRPPFPASGSEETGSREAGFPRLPAFPGHSPRI
jgi:integrase